MHKILFYNKFIIRLNMFRALCAHHQEVKILLYSVWYHHTCRWPSRAQLSTCAQCGSCCDPIWGTVQPMNTGTENRITGLWAEIRNRHPHSTKQNGIHSTATLDF